MTEKPWQTGKPPNEKIVEVELGNGIIIRVFAFYGRDGYLPHWRSETGEAQYSVDTFHRWRYPEDKE